MRRPGFLFSALLWTLALAAGLGPRASAAPPATFLAAPEKTSEELAPGQPIPYFQPLPGMKVDSWRVEEDAMESTLPPQKSGFIRYIGPPLLRVTYVQTGAVRQTPRQVTDTYRRALTAAGWEVEAPPGLSAATVAHFTQHGRNLWLRFQADPRAVDIMLWDAGASAQATKLRDALTQKGRVAVYGIAFDINKATFRPEAAAVLMQILKLLQEAPDLKLEVQVHTDNSFRDVYGRSPSADRARSIVAWLVTHGVNPVRLVAQGYGETIPLQDNRTPAGRARNRRVELVLLPQRP